MSVCCCSLAGTAACQTCPQNPFAVMSNMMTPQQTALRDIMVNPQIEKPTTNADRIRGMTDEELAQFFHDCVACDDCPVGDSKCKRAFALCKNTALSWLKAPVEEVDNGT